MTKKLDPIISEFETQEQADSYDKWFRAKVQHSLANPGKLTPHAEVMDRMKRVIAAAVARRKTEPK